MTSHIRALLFDKDGTLFHYHETWFGILDTAALKVAGSDRALADHLLTLVGVDPATGRSASGSISAAGNTDELALRWQALNRGWETERFVEALDDLFAAEGPKRAVPVTDLARLLHRLRGAGYRMGLATNDSLRASLAMLDAFSISGHFEFMAGYDSGHGAKPGPGMAQAFCAATGLAPGAVAMIGDNAHDFEMARQAGLGLKIGVLTGTSDAADLAAHTDVILGSIEELPDYFGLAVPD